MNSTYTPTSKINTLINHLNSIVNSTYKLASFVFGVVADDSKGNLFEISETQVQRRINRSG